MVVTGCADDSYLRSHGEMLIHLYSKAAHMLHWCDGTLADTDGVLPMQWSGKNERLF